MSQKILFVINTMGCGGAETALLNLLDQVLEEGAEVSLYVLLEQGELISRVPKQVRLLNKHVSADSVLEKTGAAKLRKTVLKKAARHGSLFRRLPYMAANLVRMIRRGRIQADKLLWQLVADGSERFDEEYDLAVAFLEGGSTYYVANHVKARKKVAFLHVDYTQAGYSPALDAGCYDAFDQVFTVSDEVKDSFAAVYPDHPVDVLHNRLLPGSIRRKAEEAADFGDDFDGIRLLSVGRLVPQKAFEISVDAMKIMRDQGVKARWYVLGDGTDRAKLEEQIVRLGLQDDFRLLGIRSNPYPYFKQADVYVHASRFEGKSIAIQEAQILGKAIVVSDCSGNREQVTSGIDGLICQLSAPELADAILRFINDPALRAACGAGARDRSESLGCEVDKLLKFLPTD